MPDFGYSAGEFVALAQLAFKAYQIIRKCGENFARLGLDVECLLVNVNCLSDAKTQILINRYVQDDTQCSMSAMTEALGRRREIEALKNGLEDIILPLVVLLVANEDVIPSEARDKRLNLTETTITLTSDKIIQAINRSEKQPKYLDWKPKQWIRYARAAFKLNDLTEVRSRCNLHAANLSLFMTRLMQHQIQFEAEESRKRSEAHTADQNKAIMSQLQRQYELQTLTYAHQLILRADAGHTQQITMDIKHLEKNVATYVAYLLNGGRPFDEKDLRMEAREDSYLGETSPNLYQQVDSEDQEHGERGFTKRRQEIKRKLEDQRRQPKLVVDRTKMMERMRMEEEEAKMQELYRYEREVRKQEERERPKCEKPVRLTDDINTQMTRDIRMKLVEASQRVAFARNGFFCDACNEPLYFNDQYYTCPNQSHPNFDLCLNCYEDHYACPGQWCGPMVKDVMRRQLSSR